MIKAQTETKSYVSHEAYGLKYHVAIAMKAEKTGISLFFLFLFRFLACLFYMFAKTPALFPILEMKTLNETEDKKMKTFKEFEEFEKEMAKTAEEAKKAKWKAEEKKITEMENVHTHCISEITQTLFYLYQAISPYLDSFRFFCGNDGLEITSYNAEVHVVINGAQITVCFETDYDATFEFCEESDIDMLSEQVKLLRDVDAFLETHIDNIMSSALLECGTVDVSDADTGAQPLYHVAIATSM